MMELRDVLVGVMVLGLMSAFVLLIMAEVQDEIENRTSNTSKAYIAAGEGIDAVAEIPSWLGILVIVIIASFIIGFLVRAFYFQRGSAGGTA